MTMHLQTWTEFEWLVTACVVVAFVSLLGVLALMWMSERTQPRLARVPARPVGLGARHHHLHGW
jgi:hypothetical protein